jgi:hypothetical protein
VNTLHYKIIIEFANQSPVAILETHNSLRVRKEVRPIMISQIQILLIVVINQEVYGV